MRNVTDPQKYEQDLSECQGYAQQIDPVGNAAAGAIGGATGGGMAGGNNQKDIIRRCMMNRGYEVLH